MSWHSALGKQTLVSRALKMISTEKRIGVRFRGIYWERVKYDRKTERVRLRIIIAHWVASLSVLKQKIASHPEQRSIESSMFDVVTLLSAPRQASGTVGVYRTSPCIRYGT